MELLDLVERSPKSKDRFGSQYHGPVRGLPSRARPGGGLAIGLNLATKSKTDFWPTAENDESATEILGSSGGAALPGSFNMPFAGTF